MKYDITGVVICALVGFAVAFVNYVISKKILETSPEKFALATVVRQVIQVGYLVAVYFVGSRIEINLMYALIGAVAGMTVPMLFFTRKLVSFNQQLTVKNKNGEEDKNG